MSATNKINQQVFMMRIEKYLRTFMVSFVDHAKEFQIARSMNAIDSESLVDLKPGKLNVMFRIDVIKKFHQFLRCHLMQCWSVKNTVGHPFVDTSNVLSSK